VHTHTCTHRHDLDEDGGEVLEVRVVESVEALVTQMAQWTASGNVRDLLSCAVDDMGGYFAPFAMQVDRLCVCVCVCVCVSV
jgi:hypothetical protein